MKVAIASWQGRVSPVFDAAGNLLLVDVERSREVRREERAMTEGDLLMRAKAVAQIGADVLICGALSRPLEMGLASAGVEVVPHVCGDVEDVLAAFVNGRLSESDFLMPGCRGRGGRLVLLAAVSA